MNAERRATDTLAVIQAVEGAAWAVLFAGYWWVAARQHDPWSFVLLVPAAIHFAVAAGLLVVPSRWLIAQRVISWIGIARIPFGTVQSAATLEVVRQRRMSRKNAIMIIAGCLLWQAVILGVLLPNLMSGMVHSEEKRTMADIRAMATVIEQYASDHNRYPDGHDMETLAAAFSAKDRASFKLTDAFGRPYRVESGGDTYVIASAGADGEFEYSELSRYLGDATGSVSPKGNIVYSNGSFVRYPSPGPCCD